MGVLTRRALAPALLAGVAAAGPASALAASFPPELRFRSLTTPQATVHFHDGLEAMARRAASLSTAILDEYEARYGWRVPRVHVVLADVDDDPNGFASPLPYPLVHLRAAGPDGTDDFGNHDGWLRLVLTHELAHVVHLDQARGILGAGRRVFGRAPFLFPNGASPVWMVEGLATWEETENTAFGRGRNPDSRMVLRMDALDRGMLGDDRAATRDLDRWPGGNAAYLHGEAFLRDLSDRVGRDFVPRAARVHSGRPFPFLDELTARKLTGTSFHAHWKAWSERMESAFRDDARRAGAAGLTRAAPLTDRGIRQVGPRWSPDGARVAYTSRTLTAYRQVRVMDADGGGDRAVTVRNGGQGLSWTPDGRSLVYDEPEAHGLFRTRSDLRIVDVATGARRWLTRGERARDPDVHPGGNRVVYVRVRPDGADLALRDLAGGEPRILAGGEAGTYFADPRWSPAGDALVASRLLPGGWLDVVRIDPGTGAVEALTADRAKDVEPDWTPDGTHVVFRSDRDGTSNVYALRLSDRALFRVTKAVGGAFSPDVSPDGRQAVLASYSASGYDVVRLPFAVDGLVPAGEFVDPYGAPRAAPEPWPGEASDYAPFSTLRPRFWSPFVTAGDEWRFGVLTAGADALFRHAYGGALEYGAETRRVDAQAYYLYDRFRPTLLLAMQDDTEAATNGLLRERELSARITWPLARRLRYAHSASLTWRGSRRTLLSPTETGRADRSGIEAAWGLSSARQFPYTTTPVEGVRARVAFLQELTALGSDVELGKLTADLRAYRRGLVPTHGLALRVGGGTTFGRPAFRTSFAVGGFPDGSLFDLVRTNHSVLRGYAQDAFTGRRFAHANLEYRFPLAHPQRGWASLPVFVRHLHGAVFADAGHAWSGPFRMGEVRTSVGAAVGADLSVSHAVPLTVTLGAARGLAEDGEARAYFRAGLSF